MGTEIWVVATGGAYGAAMVATPEAKPGLLLDRMEAELLAADESRSLDAREPVLTAPRVVDLSAAAAQEPPRAVQPATPEVRPPAAAPVAVTPATPAPPAKTANVDRVALAREFSRLFDSEDDR